MTHEMASMRWLGVFAEAPASSLPPGVLRTAITARWVHRWKGDTARSRLVCRGFNEPVTDEDQTYASTPLVAMVKLLILLSLSLDWHIEFWGGGTAFSACYGHWRTLRGTTPRVLRPGVSILETQESTVRTAYGATCLARPLGRTLAYSQLQTCAISCLLYTSELPTIYSV